MSDPNPYVTPIRAVTVGELRAALDRFTIDDQALPVVLHAGGYGQRLRGVRFDSQYQTCDLTAGREP